MLASGRPIQAWCGVVNAADAQISEVLSTRAKPVSEGGRGADVDVLRRRVQMDRESSAGYTSIGWRKFAACCFYTGLSSAMTYVTVPTLFGGEPLAVPDYYKVEAGKVHARISAMGMSSPDLMLEMKQVIPASGGVLVPLKYWPEGLATFARQREKFGSVTLGELIR